MNKIKYLLLFLMLTLFPGCALIEENNYGRCEFAKLKFYDHKDEYLFTREIRYCLHDSN